jgi:hypothetical protein
MAPLLVSLILASGVLAGVVGSVLATGQSKSIMTVREAIAYCQIHAGVHRPARISGYYLVTVDGAAMMPRGRVPSQTGGISNRLPPNAVGVGSAAAMGTWQRTAIFLFIDHNRVAMELYPSGRADFQGTLICGPGAVPAGFAPVEFDVNAIVHDGTQG